MYPQEWVECPLIFLFQNMAQDNGLRLRPRLLVWSLVPKAHVFKITYGGKAGRAHITSRSFAKATCLFLNTLKFTFVWCHRLVILHNWLFWRHWGMANTPPIIPNYFRVNRKVKSNWGDARVSGHVKQTARHDTVLRTSCVWALGARGGCDQTLLLANGARQT